MGRCRSPWQRLWYGPAAMLRRAFFFGFLALIAMLLGSCSRGQGPAAAAREVILATTTSTQDSGLLGVLLPEFEKARNIKVKVIAVGTGEALALGARGDADILLVHARAAEDEFMAKGYGLLRLDVMHNDFVLVGPLSDPAKAKGQGIIEAFRKIHEAASTYASRGDKSGTHKKEQDLWRAAGVDPSGKPWYLSTGQGQGETARVATEKQAYTLIDRGTWLSMKSSLKLEVVSEGDPKLHNPYGVIVVSAQKFPKVHEAEAKELAEWLVSAQAQRRIGAFGRERYGQALFVPDAIPEGGR